MSKKADGLARFIIYGKEKIILAGKGGPRHEIVIKTVLAPEINKGDCVMLEGFRTKKHWKARVVDKTEERIIVALKHAKSHHN